MCYCAGLVPAPSALWHLRAAATLFAALSCSGTALAYEDQVTLGIWGGGALASGREGSGPGAALGLDATLGLGEAWSLDGQLGYGLHPGRQPAPVGLASLELQYLVDVFEVVPVVGLGADVLFRGSGAKRSLEGGLHLHLGAEYLVRRDLTLGLDLRALVLPASLSGAPVYLLGAFRIGLVFDR